MNQRAARIAASLGLILLLGLATAGSALAAFGLSSYDVTIQNEDGTPASLAGSHPFSFTTDLNFNTMIDGEGREVTDGLPRDVTLKLPPGFSGDPTAVPRCSNADFLATPGGTEETLRYTTCPDSAAVGLADLIIGYNGPGKFFAPVYNLEPLPGQVQRLGFVALGGVPVTIGITVSEAPPFNVIAKVTSISQIAFVYGSKITLWGNPASSVHDPLRGQCIAPLGFPVNSGNPSVGSCPVSTEEKPLLTLPGRCDGPLKTTIEVRSWEQPNWLTAVSESHDDSEPPQPLSLTGCEELPFSPSIEAEPTSKSSRSATGLDFGLRIEDEGLTDVDGQAAATVRRAEVTLPNGFVTNPSIAEGLVSCSRADLARETASSAPGVGCPLASKIGSLEVETPVLEDPIGGSLFVAKPFDNDAGNSLLGLYMVLKSARYGIAVKQPLEVKPDAGSGQLTTVASELPQLPFSHFRLHFREGPRSPLTTPASCGSYAATAVLTPWSGGAAFVTDSVFEITTGPSGGPCPAGGGPFDPSFEAGSVNPLAGDYSPFVLRLARASGSQQLSGLETTLPPGLIGKLAGLSECSEAQIASARTRSVPLQGAVELASPSCPANSEVGIVRVGAGSGSPAFVSGRAYLGGPYKGAPLSLAIITPAVSGPFDLGAVVVRAALQVDQNTAQVSALSDPFPSIIAGIPLDIRSVAVEMNRPKFMLNPTNCEPMAITGVATSLLGAVAPLSERFQVGGCGGLGFKPKLSVRLKGGTKRSANTALSAVYTSRGGDANLAGAVVILPPSQFIDNAHISNPCTRVQFAANACPRKSILGRASAYSPLLDKPLKGSAYFRSNGGERDLPDVVVALKGQIDFNLVIAVLKSRGGRIATKVLNAPDAPVSKFVLKMAGGKRGLFENSENLCRRKQRANLIFTGQNGRVFKSEPTIQTSCKKR